MFLVADTKFKVILEMFFLKSAMRMCYLVEKLLYKILHHQWGLIYYQANLDYW